MKFMLPSRLVGRHGAVAFAVKKTVLIFSFYLTLDLRGNAREKGLIWTIEILEFVVF